MVSEILVEDLGKIIMMEKYHRMTRARKECVCYDENGHGMVDFLHAVALSCDVYFYKFPAVSARKSNKGLGVWKMAEHAGVGLWRRNRHRAAVNDWSSA